MKEIKKDNLIYMFYHDDAFVHIYGNGRPQLQKIDFDIIKSSFCWYTNLNTHSKYKLIENKKFMLMTEKERMLTMLRRFDNKDEIAAHVAKVLNQAYCYGYYHGKNDAKKKHVYKLHDKIMIERYIKFSRTHQIPETNYFKVLQKTKIIEGYHAGVVYEKK